MSASNYLESGVLNHLFRTDTFSKPTTVAVALCTGVPQDTQNGETIPEVPNAGGYARVDLGAPANADWTEVGQSNGSGIIDNAAAITFPQATSNWGMVSGVAIVDSASHGAGHVLLSAQLSTPRDIRENDTFQFATGALDLLLS